jgi:hypothetical protein
MKEILQAETVPPVQIQNPNDQMTNKSRQKSK